MENLLEGKPSQFSSRARRIRLDQRVRRCPEDLCNLPSITLNEEAVQTSLRLAREEGILCGISSGANVAAALKYAAKEENQGKMIVAIVCDFGERYVQTVLFDSLRYEGSDQVGA